MTTAIWQLQHVTLKGGEANRLDDLSLKIANGVTAIVGHSGAGKTSLLNILAGLEKPTSGSVRRLPEETRTDVPGSPGPAPFSLPLFWAPQDAGLWPHLSAIEHLTAVFEGNLPKTANHERESTDFLDNLLIDFDLDHRRQALPGELSLGERSRLAICRALAANPAVLLMDEPLAHVDPIRRPIYWKLIRTHLQTTKAALVFATHEPEVAIRESKFVICMSRGKIVHSGETQELYHAPPSQTAAEFLGPTNWFDKTEIAVWLNEDNSTKADRSLRPEQLHLEPVTDADYEILSFEFSGSYSETTLTHVPTASIKTIIHRPAGNVHQIGQRVLIKVLS